MCNSIEWGRCEICGKETQLERTYFYYPIHCECCGNKENRHFEMIRHCKKCPAPMPKEIDVLVDCRANEELFLAIAALRDDTDKYQWFTDGDLWFKCGDEVCNEGRKIHKATVNELIEHFKIKEEQ